jgi:hypothetical protein
MIWNVRTRRHGAQPAQPLQPKFDTPTQFAVAAAQQSDGSWPDAYQSLAYFAAMSRNLLNS